ncbi:Mariner transposase [Oopsacas minuta]|uniref:Mariner transposase n=1 Tax=Oopsacas minuta TaxID=111878 RepID=A0AAV7KCB3_9METZ|nr:Mariner transposase [Oopsacas minuta]
MMFYDFMRKISVEQSHDILVEAFQDQAPSKRTVERWYLDFRRERTSLQDEARSGGPSTTVTPETIAAAEILIREDSRINYEQLAVTLKIGKPPSMLFYMIILVSEGLRPDGSLIISLKCN